MLFPPNLNVSLDFVLGNIEILGKQNSLFPSFLKVVFIHLSVIPRKTMIHNKSFKCLDLIRFYYGGPEAQNKNKCRSIKLYIFRTKILISFKFKIFRSNAENCVPVQNLINSEFKKLRR